MKKLGTIQKLAVAGLSALALAALACILAFFVVS